MPITPAPALILRDVSRVELQSWTRSTSIKSGLAMRARIILLAAQGEAISRIADRAGTTPTTVWKWRGRYEADGIAGLLDESRSGRPKRIDAQRAAETYWAERTYHRRRRQDGAGARVGDI